MGVELSESGGIGKEEVDLLVTGAELGLTVAEKGVLLGTIM